MGLDLDYSNGQTPLDEDEREGLLIKSISTRTELDEFEQQNIEQASIWTLKRKFKSEDILSEPFVRELHRRMYRDVWSWAGAFRKTNKNIGVDKLQIGIELKILIDDCKFWIENKTFEPDEIVICFKHRLVSIHCFPNGNGRHSRLMADVMMEHIFKREVFSWGAKRKGDERKEYLKAIKAADVGNYELLLTFARS